MFAPRNADNIGLFNASSLTFSVEDIRVTGSKKYSGATATRDGLIVFTPRNQDNVLVFNPRNGTHLYVSTGSIKKNDKFLGGVLGDNGLVVFPPYEESSIGLVRLTTFPASVRPLPFLLSFSPTSGSFARAQFDASTNTFSSQDISSLVTYSKRYVSAAVASNGLVVMAPYGKLEQCYDQTRERTAC